MADNQKYVQTKEFSLAIGANTGATSIRVRLLKDIDGTVLTMDDFGSKGFGTLEPNTSREEQIVFTGITDNGDDTYTLTGVSNVLAQAPYTESSGTNITHTGGATFIISNNPGLYNTFANKNNDETIAQTWTFTSPNYPKMDSAATAPNEDEDLTPKKYVDDQDETLLDLAGTRSMTGDLDMDSNKIVNLDTPTANGDAANKSYVDGVALSGAPDASTTVKGVVEEATQAEVNAGTATGGTGARLFVNPSTLPNTIPTVQTFSPVALGDNTTQYDITNPSGSTFRYTYDTNGTDPGITSSTVPTGAKVLIATEGSGGDIDKANAGIFTVTGSGTNYFEVTNANGSVESNVDSIIYVNQGTWTKPSNVKYVVVEVVGGGGAGDADSSNGGGAGGAGGYAKKLIDASTLGSTEAVVVGLGGIDYETAGVIYSGTESSFDSLTANGGTGADENDGGAGGSASGGDINIPGQSGSNNISTSSGTGGIGGDSFYGIGGASKELDGGTAQSGNDGVGYGAGGGGASDGTGTPTGGNGTNGIVIVTEYYAV